MPLAVTFPLSGRFRDLHPLEHVRAGRTKIRTAEGNLTFRRSVYSRHFAKFGFNEIEDTIGSK